jgi:hypothetical protein
MEKLIFKQKNLIIFSRIFLYLLIKKKFKWVLNLVFFKIHVQSFK